MDLSSAFVFPSPHLPSKAQKVVNVLLEEVERRTGIKWKKVDEWITGDIPLIFLACEKDIGDLSPRLKARIPKIESEGYCIITEKTPLPVILIVGKDNKGLLYGVGKFLRKLNWGKDLLKLDGELSICSAPRYSLRGHQLGYRPKTNAYDAWSPEQFDQYIRELALFGANSIEILPPRTDDEPTSPHMKVQPLEMMVRLSEIIDSYGMDVWVWYPNVGKDYTDSKCLEEEKREREEIFRLLPKIDAVFIPGGDPGDLPPDLLFSWAEEVSKILAKYHPEAKIWLSPQSAHEGWIEGFLAEVDKRPEWLGGIVFGPWVQLPLPELRERIPQEYPIRHYPDITHSLQCQYPVWNWDLAFAITLGRECINPRPKAMKHIHNLLAPYTIGSITYSEGINDDVNKFIWSDQDWDPSTDVGETLRDYARLFISPQFADEIAQGFLALEENWEEPLLINQTVDITLMQWQEMERRAPKEVLNNYRFQMGLLRAYYDAYIKRRLIYETELERRARDSLRLAPQIGSTNALEEAEEILRKAKTEPVSADYKKRCEKLADELFKNIGAQLSVIKHKAIGWSRGAFMDDIDMPLNNSRWFSYQFQRIKKLMDENERLKAISVILERENPGPGGFYDNFGTSSFKRVVREKSWKEDPGNLTSPFISFVPSLLHLDAHLEEEIGGIPLSWIANLTALYDIPITIVYEHVEPNSLYTIRITYIGEHGGRVKLVANDDYVVHDFLEIKGKIALTVEFPIPLQAIKKGKLTLTWLHEGGRRTHIAEVWLMKEIRGNGC